MDYPKADTCEHDWRISPAPLDGVAVVCVAGCDTHLHLPLRTQFPKSWPRWTGDVPPIPDDVCPTCLSDNRPEHARSTPAEPKNDCSHDGGLCDHCCIDVCFREFANVAPRIPT